MPNDHKAFSETLPKKRTAAGALFTNKEGKVLLVVPTYKSEWEIPGGTVEENESPKQACEREVLEELGISVKIGRLLRLDYRAETDHATELLIFLFEGGELSDEQVAAITLPDDELSACHFVKLNEAKKQLLPTLYQLVESGLQQRNSQHTLYSEFSATVEDQ
jgi:8-oxo-dGTP pyrophosphatase MutT (NUDIX family)